MIYLLEDFVYILMFLLCSYMLYKFLKFYIVFSYIRNYLHKSKSLFLFNIILYALSLNKFVYKITSMR